MTGRRGGHARRGILLREDTGSVGRRTTGRRRRRSVRAIVHRFLPTPIAGTRLPALVLDGWGAGETDVRSHQVPAPGARWTLVLLSPASRPEVDEHRARLAAESVTPVVMTGSPRVSAAVLVDPAGVIQHASGTVEEALDVVAAFRQGRRMPTAPQVRRCPGEGRRRSASRVAGRRAA